MVWARISEQRELLESKGQRAWYSVVRFLRGERGLGLELGLGVKYTIVGKGWVGPGI